MTYILLISFFLFLIYLFIYIVNKDSKIEKEISAILEKRLKYTENEYRKAQELLFILKYKEWTADNEFDIRRTAITKMNSVILGTISSELSIINKNFAFNPKDIKFIGRFIDMIIFDGAADEELVNIYFVSIVREGLAAKNEFKNKVSNAIKNGHVTFQEINL